VRDTLESDDVASINAKTQALQEAFHKVSEQMYAAAAQAQQADGAGTNGADGAGAAEAPADEEEVVDAEVVDGERES
jgi:molecular chaperone DnaK